MSNRGKKKLIAVFAGMTLVMLVICMLMQALLIKKEPVVSLSAASGFYDTPFELTMSGENGDIYYTLDGSRPDEGSLKYTAPVYITDASANDNNYSMRTDVAACFDHDLIKQQDASTPEDYVQPDYLVDKCTVVRAVCIDSLGGRSQEACASYFVGFDDKYGYDDVMFISLYTDPYNLFDYEKGIYVTGKVMDDYIKSGKQVDNDHFWWWWPANYRQKGRDWEREARVEFFGENRALLQSKDIGIRIQGGGTRGYLPRSLNLYAREEYDGKGRFDKGLFSDDYEPSVVTVFSGGDSRTSKYDDFAAQHFASNLNISTMEMKPAVLFLNGEYWGFYFLTERYEEQYFEHHYNVASDNVIMIKNGEIALGSEKDIQAYEQDMKLLKSMDVSTPEGYERLKEIIDLDSYIDYYAMQLYIDRRNDWPAANFALWKTREKTDDGYGDSRWRWMLFDDNSGSYGKKNVSSNSIENTRAVDWQLDNLLKSPEIDKRLRERMVYLAENVMTNEATFEYTEQYREMAAPLMHNEFKRFFGKKRDYDDRFQAAMDRFNIFFKGRNEYIRKHSEDL